MLIPLGSGISVAGVEELVDLGGELTGVGYAVAVEVLEGDVGSVVEHDLAVDRPVGVVDGAVLLVELGLSLVRVVEREGEVAGVGSGGVHAVGEVDAVGEDLSAADVVGPARGLQRGPGDGVGTDVPPDEIRVEALRDRALEVLVDNVGEGGALCSRRSCGGWRRIGPARLKRRLFRRA